MGKRKGRTSRKSKSKPRKTVIRLKRIGAKIPIKKGALSKTLGIPEKQNIPKTLLKKIKRAKTGTTIKNPSKKGKRSIKVTSKTKKQATLALTLKGFKPSKTQKSKKSKTTRKSSKKSSKSKSSKSQKSKGNPCPKKKNNPNSGRMAYLKGKLIHEGYYSDEGMAKRRAKKLRGYSKYISHGLYAGSYEVFAPVPLTAKLKLGL